VCGAAASRFDYQQRNVTAEKKKAGEYKTSPAFLVKKLFVD